MNSLPPDIQHWLQTFANAVRAKQLSDGEALFHPDVIAYGTVCSRADGLNELVSAQWDKVWPVTEHFDFNYDTATCIRDGDIAVIMSEWSSEGQENCREHGMRFGRATILLKKHGSILQAIHTHFSLTPEPQ